MQFTRFPLQDDGNTISTESGNFFATRTPSGFDIIYTGGTHTGNKVGTVIGRRFIISPECGLTFDVGEMVDLTCLLLTCAYGNGAGL
jgi:hypothetical protein